MASTTVYGCDWCSEIIPKASNGSDTARFAAKITAEQLWPYPAMGSTPDIYEICDTCRKAFRALTEGKYRRA